MNILEKIKALLYEHRDELNKEFEAMDKTFAEGLKKYAESDAQEKDDKKKVKTLVIGQFEKIVQKDVSGDYLIIKGIASNATVDRGSDIVVPDGIKVISDFNNKLPMLNAHDHEQIVGSWYKYGNQNGQYVVEGRLYKEYNPVVFDQVNNGDLQALSIGFKPLDYEYDPKTGVMTYKSIDLFEVSLVAVGMHQEARITSVSPVQSKSVNKSSNETSTSEGETPTVESPVIPAEEVKTETVKTEEATATPEAQAEPAKTEEIDWKGKVDALEARVSQLEAEKTELEATLNESLDVIESQDAQLEKKYELKRKG